MPPKTTQKTAKSRPGGIKAAVMLQPTDNALTNSPRATNQRKQVPRTYRTKNTDQANPRQTAIIKVAQENPTLTTRQIGTLVNCDHSTVVRTLARYGVDQGQVESYKKHRADIFAGLQHRLLASCTDEDIQKTPAIQRITGAAILYDKERLETGKSSENVNILVAGLKEMQEARWGRSPVDSPVDNQANG